jgi:hypothetical protein
MFVLTIYAPPEIPRSFNFTVPFAIVIFLTWLPVRSKI